MWTGITTEKSHMDITKVVETVKYFGNICRNLNGKFQKIFKSKEDHRIVLTFIATIVTAHEKI